MNTDIDASPSEQSAEDAPGVIVSRSLWKNEDFLRLWGGQTISMFGSQITPIAIPLVASLMLSATPRQMAFLLATQYAPYTLVGLFAGAWVDRMRRRPILIAADIGRAFLLLALPLAWWLGLLRMELIYVVSFLMGVLSVGFNVAYGAFLPAVVSREHLVEGNSRLETSSAVAGIAGPALAGILIQLLAAPVAVGIDGLSFLVSALSIVGIRTPDPVPPRPEHPTNIWRDIADGLRFLAHNPYLRTLQLTMATLDIFWNALFAVYFLYVTRVLHLPAAAIGSIFGIGSVGALLGALVAARVARRIGLGPSIIVAECLVGCGGLLIAASAWQPSLGLPLLIAAEVIQSGANTVFGINGNSVRQAVTPAYLRGRMGASRSAIGLGVATIGVTIGGVLGERIGVTPLIVVGACGGMFAFLWLLFSPIRTLRELPAPMDDPLPAATP